jgi:hypothetical protein
MRSSPEKQLLFSNFGFSLNRVSPEKAGLLIPTI